MEILQHGMSGKLYAAEYADGMTMASLSNIVGPLSVREALLALDEGIEIDGRDDVEWAQNQPWNVWQGEAAARDNC